MRRLPLGALAMAGYGCLAALAADVPTVNDGYGVYVMVPAGSFKMGDNFGEGNPRERPVHVVALDAYYIGKYAVTNGEYKKFRDSTDYENPSFWPEGKVIPREPSFWEDKANHGGGIPGSDDFPTIGVTWNQAVAYCRWVSAKTGKRYRLPTEAEWEKAARGTDQRRYPWGNQTDPSYTNYLSGRGPYNNSSSPVGFYDGAKHADFETHSNASPYGAFDMAGGVFEWCQDWYSRNYYSFSPAKNPQGPPTGGYRVIRGGSWYVELWEQRSANRSSGYPSFGGHRQTGFRAVREP
jgi:formylglycine-generating enzyme required for sulfatase activity